MAINPQTETFNALQAQARREVEVGPKGQLLAELRAHPEFANLEAAAAGSGQAIIDAINLTPSPLVGASADAMRLNTNVQRANPGDIIRNIDAVIDPAAAITPPERVALVDEARNRVVRDFRAQLRTVAGTNPADVAAFLGAYQGGLTGDLSTIIPEITAFAQLRMQEMTQANEAQDIRTGANAAISPTPITDIPDLAGIGAVLGNVNALPADQLGVNARALRTEIGARAANLIEGRINAYVAGNDLNDVAALDAEIAALPPGLLTARETARLTRLRDEKVRQSATQIQTNVTTTWNNMRAGFHSYAEAEAAVGPLIDQAIAAANVPALAGDPLLARINRAALLAEFQARDVSALSNDVLAYRAANPAGDVNGFVAGLTAAELQNFGGRNAVIEIFNRNTDPDRQEAFVRGLAEAVQQRGGTLAEAQQLIIDNGFDAVNFAALHTELNNRYNELAGTQIRQDLDRALGFMNEALGWNELTNDGKHEQLLGARRNDVIQILHDQGMTQAQIDRALNRLDDRLDAEEMLMGYDTAPTVQGEHFDNLRNTIEADLTLSANQREVLTRRLNLAEEALDYSTGFVENALRNWFHLSQEQIDQWRGTGMWLRLQGVNLLAFLKIAVIGGGAAALIASGLAPAAILLLGAGSAYVMPSWWKQQRRVRTANEAASLAMAERRVALDSLTEMTRNTVGALNYISDAGGLAALTDEEREVAEQMGIVRGGRVDVGGIIARVNTASQQYGKTVDGLKDAFDKRVKTLRGLEDPRKIVTTGSEALNFNLPGNLLTAPIRRRTP